MSGVYFFMSFYLQNVRGYSPMHAGLLTTPVALGQLVASNRSASLVRRFGAKSVAAGGLAVVTGAVIGYHALTTMTPIAALECIFFLQGAGMGIVMPTATELVMSVVPRERGGPGSAITNTSRQGAGAPRGAVLRPIPARAHRGRGRPRSEQADRAIIDATLEMFAESGAEGLCIEKVAARAGVGKATIYRRWPGKEDLLLDALAALQAPLPEPRGESVRDDLVALLDAMRSESVDPRRVRQFALLLGEGAQYPRLIERYVETVVDPRRDVFRAGLRRGG